MAVWVVVEGISEVESKQVTEIAEGADTGTVKVFRREVLTTVYESRTHNFSFTWSAAVAETTLFGDEDTQRVVSHSFRRSPITGAVIETKVVVKPGKWKHVATYDIGEVTE